MSSPEIPDPAGIPEIEPTAANVASVLPPQLGYIAGLCSVADMISQKLLLAASGYEQALGEWGIVNVTKTTFGEERQKAWDKANWELVEKIDKSSVMSDPDEVVYETEWTEFGIEVARICRGLYPKPPEDTLRTPTDI